MRCALPERAAPVARRVPCRREQRSSSSRTRPGLGKRAVADVVLEVEVVVLGPDPLAGGGDRRGCGRLRNSGDISSVVSTWSRRAGRGRSCGGAPSGFSYSSEAAHVHRHAAVLGQQEAQSGRIERGRHPAILGPRGVGSPPLGTWHDRRHGAPGRAESLDRLCGSRGRIPAHLGGEPRRPMAVEGWQIGQCAIAAGVAWFIAHDVVGHTTPFFAPIAAVLCLGTSYGQRRAGSRRSRSASPSASSWPTCWSRGSARAGGRSD